MTSIRFQEASSSHDYQLAAALFKEYAGQLGIDLEFQDFKTELEYIEQIYRRPFGSILLVYINSDNLAGCAGIRKFENTICELKRMYLRKPARGQGMGKALLQKSIALAKELKYTRMRLDTLPTMKQAIKLYEQEGFYEISSYRYNPIKGTKYFEIELSTS